MGCCRRVATRQLDSQSTPVSKPIICLPRVQSITVALKGLSLATMLFVPLPVPPARMKREWDSGPQPKYVTESPEQRFGLLVDDEAMLSLPSPSLGASRGLMGASFTWAGSA